MVLPRNDMSLAFSVAGRAMCPGLPVRPAGPCGGFWKSPSLRCTEHCSPYDLERLVTLAVEPPKWTGADKAAAPVELLPWPGLLVSGCHRSRGKTCLSVLGPVSGSVPHSHAAPDVLRRGSHTGCASLRGVSDLGRFNPSSDDGRFQSLQANALAKILKVTIWTDVDERRWHPFRPRIGPTLWTSLSTQEAWPHPYLALPTGDQVPPSTVAPPPGVLAQPKGLALPFSSRPGSTPKILAPALVLAPPLGDGVPPQRDLAPSAVVASSPSMAPPLGDLASPLEVWVLLQAWLNPQET
ncbi:hypothetical protein P7K49_036929 [Saguinus oedipus]|uniref:Uncharacterized protein n=1 Tax=Saguinus oedipus TaxID=9490 RepID=A0ABQ9TLQ4_SAGOE|nr:hypothetical protein P7K49_036929 [Saguinus oedipus]